MPSGHPCSTGIYTEKSDSGVSSDRSGAGNHLISRNIREQIPYMAEQGNKSDEQGGKIDEQGIKSPEHRRRDSLAWRGAARLGPATETAPVFAHE
jgi:hypothetical protein